jgi:hypothetical protein
MRQDEDPEGVVDAADCQSEGSSVSYDSKFQDYINQYWRRRRKKEETNIASPTTQYVAYQKLTSPPNLPPGGGYHGITRMKTLTASEKAIATFQTRNSVPSMPSLLRLFLISSSPNVVAKKREAASCLEVLRENLGTAAK